MSLSLSLSNYSMSVNGRNYYDTKSKSKEELRKEKIIEVLGQELFDAITKESNNYNLLSKYLFGEIEDIKDYDFIEQSIVNAMKSLNPDITVSDICGNLYQMCERCRN